MMNQNKSNRRMMLKALFVVSVATLSISAFATPKTVRNLGKTVNEIEKKKNVTKHKDFVYAVCEPSSRIVRFTNNPNEEGVRFSFPRNWNCVLVDGKPITDEQIQNPDLMKGCTYHLVPIGGHVGVDIKTEEYAKKMEKAVSK
ncbi:MAG: hypothetical protein MJZ60_11245 [Bacteroidaceae bacterium]|nr:hypothetical protein [Bacteroidaceae bacterium]